MMFTIQRSMFSGVRRLNPYNSSCLSYSRRSFTQRLVRENDIVLLKAETNQDALPTMSKPLKAGDPLVFRDHRKVMADNVIGKPYRSVVAGGRRALFRIYEPTLGQYCDLSPRIVTPIYSSDANLIVSLLDLNFTAIPSPHSKAADEREPLSPYRPLQQPIVSKDAKNLGSAISLRKSEVDARENLGATNSTGKADLLEPREFPNTPNFSKATAEITEAERLENWDTERQHDTGTLEIFEAGTGHGSLTLHLARAIHGANYRAPPLPRFPKTKGKVNADDDIYRYGGRMGENNQKRIDQYNEWRLTRRAVIHSLDSSEHHSRHAQRTIRNYRHGLYFPHIDFHVGSIHGYLSNRLEERNAFFLNHAILDIPSIEDEMEIVGKCLKTDGRLITWCPSVTQHMKCLETVKRNKLPFVLERVLELGSQLSTGGREWEVKSVKPRALIKAEMKKAAEKLGQPIKGEAVSAVESFLSGLANKDNDVEESESTSAPAEASTEEVGGFTDTSGWEMICRPKVGDRVTGGGFVGVWRKMDMKV